ncbi:hypothetical protein CA223_02485 [Sphingomonas koreensis]|jgi:hypothetical protein|uniref:Uncharacterized protein n=1 Tax=Sphingomonas koreensis TaxID=93064 RepID=A0A1L6JFF1_9SPHN|nr:hypothetical protein [Sphingomonas koreensis]APR54220.1 hypothetical protein BRX40_19005 [Sphingomonas koreensis]MDC7809225.1 hypothetical protein [Sphingomonas koreensis]PJI90176.1 hypothetical protein BDW16_3500 [Sphingomonas koreensis]RSU17307.1 hypothetical protein CA224_22075 [Sphingomonas koreensis]RSU21742.1 hypothetical protein CA225_21010 [Sphingomonas koreensis]
MRTMFKGFTAAVFVVGLAATAHAETKPGTPAPAATEAADAKPVKDKRYCVRGTLTGSRLVRQECHTRAEWLAQGFDPLDKK